MRVVEELKETYNSDALDRISTNDVISSYFFSRCKDKAVSIDFNMRERLPEIRNTLAGNYIATGSISIGDDSNPKSFRDSLLKFLNKEISASVLSYNICTNWTSFSHQLELPGYTHICHVPLFDMANVPSSMGVPLLSECFICVFKYNDEQVALQFVTYSDTLTEQYLDDCDLLDGKIVMN